jgi:hypothetical protein
MNAPIIRDFNQITDISVLTIDENPLTIRVISFITIANRAESKYTYYSRLRGSNTALLVKDSRMLPTAAS